MYASACGTRKMAQETPSILIILFYFDIGKHSGVAWYVTLCSSLELYSWSATVSGLNVEIWNQSSPIIPFKNGIFMYAVPQTEEDQVFSLCKVNQCLEDRTIEKVNSSYALKWVCHGLFVSVSFTAWIGEGEDRKGRLAINLRRKSKIQACVETHGGAAVIRGIAPTWRHIDAIRHSVWATITFFFTLSCGIISCSNRIRVIFDIYRYRLAGCPHAICLWRRWGHSCNIFVTGLVPALCRVSTTFW